MIAFRKAHPSICRSRFWRDDIRWRGVGTTTDLSFHSHSFAYYLRGTSLGDQDLYVMVNASPDPLSFTVFDGLSKPWYRVLDTSLASPDDFCEPGEEERVIGSHYQVDTKSIVVLIH
jgi:glycogen operon protein